MSVSLEAKVIRHPYRRKLVEVSLCYPSGSLVIASVDINPEYRPDMSDHDLGLEILAEGLSKLWKEDQ